MVRTIAIDHEKSDSHWQFWSAKGQALSRENTLLTQHNYLTQHHYCDLEEYCYRQNIKYGGDQGI